MVDRFRVPSCNAENHLTNSDDEGLSKFRTDKSELHCRNRIRIEMENRKCVYSVAHQIGIKFELSALNSDRSSASEFVMSFSAHQLGNLKRHIGTISYPRPD